MGSSKDQNGPLVSSSSSDARSMSSELPCIVPIVPHSFATIVYEVMTTECAARLLGVDMLSLPLP